jgi:chromosome segregation protein
VFLQKIEISGFKSFAKKTILDFSGKKGSENGVTCIVGPNGSGKSNVSDALRWVIGEKSVKNLRGNKKEDIIFAGSSSKAKLGCAQVSVFFDNSNKRFDIDYEQVIITRKVYRDGENNYLINNSKVQLFDLVSLLSKAGVGYGNYTIVNQGMTDKILLASPVERMSFLEDAAGVKEIQLKKIKSLRRMKKTEENLEKASSLMREIEPELRVLKTQARKIEKSQKTREKLFEKRKEYFAIKLNSIEKKQKKNNLELEKIKNQMSISQNLIEKLQNDLKKTDDSYIKKQNEKIEKLEQEKRAIESRRYDLERIGFKKEIELKSLEEKIEELDKEEIVLVDRTYILSKLESFKKELDDLEGKPVSKKIISKIRSLLKEIQVGKTVKKKAGKEIDEKKKVLGENLKKIRREAENNTERIENCRKSVAEKNQQIHKINQDNRKKQENRLELKDKLRREQFEIEKADKYKQHLRLERESLDRALREALEDIGNNFNGEIDDLRKIFSNKTLDDLKMEIEKLNWQLEQVKEIDNSVVGEAGELEEKYDFLKKESEDLKLTLTELKEMVVEMDKNIKVKMKKAFKAINKEFSDYFRLMFGGGTAKLERTKFEKRRIASSEDDLENEDKKEFEYGLEIKVNPPGKRIDSLNMLSGGERTLTSIALLFALISHNPPPFAFLDEIEANLDESNAGKFSRILKKLSSKTQFILATHSREVMRVADILYGITMNKKDGYSNIFSVSLTQIEKDVKINS